MSSKYMKWCAISGCGRSVRLDEDAFWKMRSKDRSKAKIYLCDRCKKYQSLDQINRKFKRPDNSYFTKKKKNKAKV